MKLAIPFKGKIGQIILVFAGLVIEAYGLLMVPQYTGRIINEGIQYGNINAIYSIGSMMILMIGISAAGHILSAYFSAKFSTSYARDLREMAYENVMNFSNNELNSISRASLITRITNDINQIETIILLGLTIVVFAPILGIGSIIKAFEIKTDLSWIIVIAFIVIMIFLFVIGAKVLPKFNTLQQYMDGINQNAREILIGMPVIKAFVRQDFEKEKFEKTNRKYLELNLNIYRNLLPMQPLLILTLNIMVVAIIYFGSYEVSSGLILTGNLVSFIQYSTQIVVAFAMIGVFMIAIPRIVVSGRRVNEILEIEPEIKDGELAEIKEHPTIEFKNVSYTYPQSETESIKNINLKLEPGKTIGIIGGTGSGKSTIINMIPRFHDPTSGEILIDGENIKNFKLNSLRDKISLTPQKSLLMEGTVKSNMIIGKHDATEGEIEAALGKAHADFVENLEDEVSQGGSNFSGGQKQRLSIARAIMRHHDFYLFDDSFSALDMNTEKIIMDNLKADLKTSSVVIVSQRISTIKDADEIIVMDDGEIIDRGNHGELYENCDIYREIVDTQSNVVGGGL